MALECGPFFCFHHVNAFEDASGNVTLDCIAMHSGVDFSMNFSNLSHEFFAKPPWRTALTRLSLNPSTSAVRFHPHILQDRLRTQVLLHSTCFRGAAISCSLIAIGAAAWSGCILTVGMRASTCNG